jgi:hypothetical protein
MSVALRAAEIACDRGGVAMVLPGDNRREPVLYALAAANAVTGRGWSLQHARDNVSVTLPAVPEAIGLLRVVPYVGPILAGLANQLGKTTMYYSPAAARDAWALTSTRKHEEGHCGSIATGGLAWCACYGLYPEVVAAAEAPCYGATMAIEHRLMGKSVEQVTAEALASLANYGADEPLYRGIIASHARMLGEGADPGGIVAETVRELREAGWEG